MTEIKPTDLGLNAKDLETVLQCLCQVFSATLNSTHDLVEREIPEGSVEMILRHAQREKKELTGMQQVCLHSAVSRVLEGWAKLNKPSV
ncbi:MAG: hypothetical protein OXD42_05100 [Rhodospirillaceae bacterium]|nr:hypothetical protein [Rhodospirillaceae bacterium]